MDRVQGASVVDLGGGKNGFRDENLGTGTEGTVLPAAWLNAIQEELLKVVTDAGLVPNGADWTQLWQALKIMGLSSKSRSRRWLTVISMTTTVPPGAPVEGDAYLVPTGATGVWAARVGQIAEWVNGAWAYLTTTDGHVISLPDGRLFERIASVYVEKIAADAQSNKWAYAVAGGTASALTVTLNPAPAALVAGMRILVKVTATNTGPTTIDVNGLGPVPIVHKDGTVLRAAELRADQLLELHYDGTYFQASLGYGRFLNVQTFFTPGVSTYTPTPGMAFVRVRMVGGGGAGGGGTVPSSGQVSLGAPGGAGAYAEGLFYASQIGGSVSVTIGAAGVGSAGASGGNGGTTSFGALMTAPGGIGGNRLLNQVAPTANGNGALSSPPTGANIAGFAGGGGFPAIAFVATVGYGGGGANSPFGTGGAAQGANTAGSAASGFGSGGGGVLVGSAAPGALAGGNGAPGFMIIEEYSL